MAIRLPSHPHRARSGILHFRIAIPPDLRQHFKTREIYRSLCTASVHEAATAAQTLLIDLKRVFTALRQKSMSNENKPPQDPLAAFSNLPDVRERIRQAGRVVRLRKLEIALEQAEGRKAEFEEQRVRDRTQHERELALVSQARTYRRCPQQRWRCYARAKEAIASVLRTDRGLQAQPARGQQMDAHDSEREPCGLQAVHGHHWRPSNRRHRRGPGADIC